MKGNDRGRMIFALVLCVLALGLTAHTQRGVESNHRDRFKQYKDLRNIRDGDLSTLAPVGEPVKLVVGPPHGELDLSAAGRPPVDYLRQYGCAADIVLTGTPRAGRSDFTIEGTFIFTEYDVDVETVIRGQTVSSASQILVLWPGGALVHKGRPITVSDASYRPLTIGRKYLLFLRQIGQGGFETIPETAGYDVTGAQAQGLGVGPLRESLKSDVLVAVAQAAVSGCSAYDAQRLECWV